MKLWEEMAYERQEARAEGRAEAEELFATLMKILLEEGKLDELKRVAEDSEYRDELCVKYQLEYK